MNRTTAPSPTVALWPLLGVLRFFLALIVAVCHASLFTATSSRLNLLQYYSGFAAVICFLLVSGFSIAASYDSSPIGFYRRRFVRIFPLYLPLVLLPEFFSTIAGKSVFWASFHADPSSGWTMLLGNIAMLQGFAVGSIASNPVVWTLSLEVFFYLIAPWLARLHHCLQLGLIAISALAFMASRYLGLPHYVDLLYGTNVLLLGWAWMLGFWIFRHRHAPSTFAIGQTIGIFALAVNGGYLNFLWPTLWTLTVICICYGHLLPISPMASRGLNLAGEISYPLYLVHFPAFCVYHELAPDASPTWYLAAAISASVALHFLVELPARRALTKLLPRGHKRSTLPILADNPSR